MNVHDSWEIIADGGDGPTEVKVDYVKSWHLYRKYTTTSLAVSLVILRVLTNWSKGQKAKK